LECYEHARARRKRARGARETIHQPSPLLFGGLLLRFVSLLFTVHLINFSQLIN
jgi:hypothetical protein